MAGVERHMKYIEKKGELGLETDMGTRAGGEHFARHLVADWDLDIEALNRYSKRFVRGKPPKLVHNIIFSMPAGTSARKVLAAVRKLALNEWGCSIDMRWRCTRMKNIRMYMSCSRR